MLEPLLLSIMVKDIPSMNSGKCLVIKCADNISLSVPVTNNNDASTLEVNLTAFLMEIPSN